MSSHAPKVTIFKTKDGEWTWHVKRGGRIIAWAGEGYKTRWGCRRSLKALQSICTDTSSTSWVSPLQAACAWALELDAREHAKK